MINWRFTAMQTPADWATRWLSDGLHLTAEGNATAFDLIFKGLTAADPSLHPDALPLDVPPHDAYGAWEEEDEEGGGAKTA